MNSLRVKAILNVVLVFGAIITTSQVAAQRTGSPLSAQLVHLHKIIAKGPKWPPQKPLPWYTAVDIVGAARDATAINGLLVYWATPSGRGRLLLPTYVPGPADAPALGSLVRIGLPSVSPVLTQMLKQDHTEILAAWFLTQLLPSDAARAYVKTYVSMGQKHLTAEDKKRIATMLTLLPLNDAPKLQKLGRGVSHYRLLIRRQQLISEALTTIKNSTNWTRSLTKVDDAVDTLRDLRSSKAASILAPYLLFRDPAKPKKASTLKRYPVATALAQIGLPTVKPLLHQVVLGDQPAKTLSVAKAVFLKMMPARVAVVFVNHAIAHQENEAAKHRLEKLKHELEQLEPHGE